MQPRLTLPLVATSFVLFFVYLYRKIAFKKQCPICKDKYPDRIPRPKLLKSLLGIVPVKAYHCKACGHRYFMI